MNLKKQQHMHTACVVVLFLRCNQTNELMTRMWSLIHELFPNTSDLLGSIKYECMEEHKWTASLAEMPLLSSFILSFILIPQDDNIIFRVYILLIIFYISHMIFVFFFWKSIWRTEESPKLNSWAVKKAALNKLNKHSYNCKWLYINSWRWTGVGRAERISPGILEPD